MLPVWASSWRPRCAGSIRETFALRDMLALLGSRQTLAAIEAGEDPAAIAQGWRAGLQAFAGLRAKYLLY